MGNRLGSVGIGASETSRFHLYPNQWGFSIKIGDSETNDKLR
jgi:hypothetical protein